MLKAIIESQKPEEEKIQAIDAIVAEQQKEVERACAEIGRLYVSLHGNDYEPAFSELFAVIKRSENTVRECRAAVREMKGVVCCETCGTDVPKTSAFCSVCGAAMPGHEAPAALSDQVRCTVCGKMVDKSRRFCTACGMPMSAVPAAEEIVPPVEEIVPPVEEIVPPVEEIVPPVEEIVPPVEEIVPPVEEIVPSVEVVVPPVEEIVPPVPTCVQCGRPLRAGALFCVECGCKIEAAPAPLQRKRFCTRCGKEVKSDARFCTGCGNPL